MEPMAVSLPQVELQLKVSPTQNASAAYVGLCFLERRYLQRCSPLHSFYASHLNKLKSLPGNARPTSCDTFVALPPATRNNCVVFGKNSDRPSGEVQEVVYVPRTQHGASTKLQENSGAQKFLVVHWDMLPSKQ
ncbi:hypothetical protein V5799_003202 [Amblyomma americanum]|uniref:Uncharacterized protein n=1 Tax=Amblyomma americanum TaxID=6943 RepID=A0AAQ4D9M5_AMBAM